MGCFDYTYADNGRNTRGCSGYLYLTKAFCEKTGLKSPIHYESMDEYGMITIKNVWENNFHKFHNKNHHTNLYNNQYECSIATKY